eukprot:Cvel_10029.t1-p1 / transcript=Cvel_10029.t1 / gene=Cvel_10029 / organism=Chromera_velia_CCMP2878 / gene_product=hypothetical protein / transcript_product=hypothetical protein / location=Cvel_scaffold596:21487-22780(-) / protein_length=322 / sequence_SO=supercontig / SO=protein_coding / is_pseudo=false
MVQETLSSEVEEFFKADPNFYAKHSAGAKSAVKMILDQYKQEAKDRSRAQLQLQAQPQVLNPQSSASAVSLRVFKLGDLLDAEWFRMATLTERCNQTDKGAFNRRLMQEIIEHQHIKEDDSLRHTGETGEIFCSITFWERAWLTMLIFSAHNRILAAAVGSAGLNSVSLMLNNQDRRAVIEVYLALWNSHVGRDGRGNQTYKFLEMWEVEDTKNKPTKKAWNSMQRAIKAKINRKEIGGVLHPANRIHVKALYDYLMGKLSKQPPFWNVYVKSKVPALQAWFPPDLPPNLPIFPPGALPLNPYQQQLAGGADQQQPAGGADQ